MITPADIENKEFSRGVRGYKEEEVDEFLDLIILDMEKLPVSYTHLNASANTNPRSDCSLCDYICGAAGNGHLCDYLQRRVRCFAGRG